MEFFSFQNNSKDLEPSYKTDLELWYFLGMGKIGIIARFHRTVTIATTGIPTIVLGTLAE